MGSRRSRNISNAALAVAVAVPALLFHFVFLYHCPGEAEQQESSDPQLWSRVCEWGREHPLGLVNVIFFLNVDVLFWIISLVQESTWVCILSPQFSLIFQFPTPKVILPLQHPFCFFFWF
jgi:hypothetical protein